MNTSSQGRMQHAPRGLAAYAQFVSWRLIDRNGAKPDKVPCDEYGNPIDPHNPVNWVSWETAASRPWGVGFVFTRNDPFFFLDFDSALVGTDWSALVRHELARFAGAYFEISQSGKGLHIIGTGSFAIPEGHATRKRGVNAELYTRARFVALTGWNMAGDAGFNCAGALMGFVQQHGFELQNAQVARIDEGRDPAWIGPEDDDELIALALTQKANMPQGMGHTPTFRELWEMDVPALVRKKPGDGGSFDHSKVDASLMAHLSYFTGRDLPRMARIFERWVGYRRDKYEARSDLMGRALKAGAINPNVMQRGPGERALVAPPSVNGANFLELLNGSQLNDMLLPERQYIVEEFLPAGCILLVGKPKKGKSWMSLELACAVAAGGEFLGHQCVQGQVIYFALEDNLRRIQSRMRMVCNAKGYDIRVVMRNVRFAAIEMNVPTVDQGFNEMLFNTLDADPSITLAIVDTLNVIRPSKGKNEDPVMYDRRCVEPYTKALASRPGRCVLLVHHARKMASDDVADGASGTLGITAAADGSMFITVGPEGKTELHGQGRDMERFELVVELKAPLWHVIGDADGIAGMSGIRAKILQCVAKYALGVGPKEIATEIQEPYANVRVRLGPMVKAGLVQKDGYGKYITTPQGASLGFVPAAN